MKNLVKVAMLTSITTAALVYVLLEWRPLGDIRQSPLVSWAASKAPEASPAPIPEPKGGATQFSDDELNNIEVYQKARPGVVNITSKSIVYTMTLFYRIPQTSTGTGSGVILDTAGHIVTNHHVIQEAEELQVTLSDKSTYTAKVIGDDPDNDLAVLKIDVSKDKLSPMTLGSSKGLQVGQKVLAIGNPFHMDLSLTTGIISALNRSIEGGNDKNIEGVIQTDAAINPGNSGGPLLNTSGEIIGINSAIVSSANGGNVGIGFAIPADTVRRITTDLITLGYVRRPYLGIEAIQLVDNPGYADLLGIEPKGMLVYRITPGSPAAQAGIQAARPGVIRGYRNVPVGGDVVLAIDGTKVNTSTELGTVIDRHKAGERVSITVLRGGQETKVPVVLQEAPH